MSNSILVIDDELEICEILRQVLAPVCDTVHEAHNGIEALDLLSKQKFQVIISDYNMPKLDGVELLKIMHEQGNYTPVIWLTGRGGQEIYREVWAHGVFDYLEKPFDVEDLLRCVKAAMTFGQSHDYAEDRPGNGHLKTIPVMIDANIYKSLLDKCMASGLSPSTLLRRYAEDFAKKAS